MNYRNRIIILSIITIILFLVSFILFLNDNVNYAIFLIVLLIIMTIYMLCLAIRKNDERSVYLRKIKKILKTYNTSIIYLENDYEFTNEDIIEVNSFLDLVKASEQTNNAIMFLDENKSSVFMVKTDKEILYYIVYQSENIKSPFKNKIDNYLYLIDENKLTKEIDNNTVVKLKNNKTYKIILIKK